MHVLTLLVLALLGWLAAGRWLPRWRLLKWALLAVMVPPALLIYPFTNNLLALWLEYEFDPDLPCLAAPPAAIVVLPAGDRHQPSGMGPWSRMAPVTAVRVLEAVSLAARYPNARLVFAGRRGEAALFRRGLDSLGVIAADRVVIDDRSPTTDLAARRLAELLASRGLNSAWLVTSALHMPRALLSFERNGLRICPYPVDFTAQRGARPWWLIPPPSAIERADRLAHELLGLFWYWATGRV